MEMIQHNENMAVAFSAKPMTVLVVTSQIDRNLLQGAILF